MKYTLAITTILISLIIDIKLAITFLFGYSSFVYKNKILINAFIFMTTWMLFGLLYATYNLIIIFTHQYLTHDLIIKFFEKVGAKLKLDEINKKLSNNKIIIHIKKFEEYIASYIEKYTVQSPNKIDETMGDLTAQFKIPDEFNPSAQFNPPTEQGLKYIEDMLNNIEKLNDMEKFMKMGNIGDKKPRKRH